MDANSGGLPIEDDDIMLLYHASTVLALVFVVCQTGAYAQIGSFRKPLAKARPRFRYWLPDASVDSNIVVADIESATRIGAGGVEFLPFYNYGYPPPPGSDWSKYGYGTQVFLKIFKDVLLAHQRHNLSMDFALGPNQGQGVPAESTNEGLQCDLVRHRVIKFNELYPVMLTTQQVPFSFSVPANGSYNGILPGWGIGELVGLVQGTVQSRRNQSRSLPGVYGPNNASWTEITLRADSLVDLTSTVLGDGRVNINTTQGNDTSQLFAFYQKQTLTKNLYWSSNDTSTIFDNGSYIVDHFSSRGAQTTIDFWEKYILVDEIDELLQSVGNYGMVSSHSVVSSMKLTD